MNEELPYPLVGPVRRTPMGRLLWPCLALGVLAVTAIGLSSWGGRRWAANKELLAKALEAGRLDGEGGEPSPTTRYDERELQGLPEPVQRYFRTVLQVGQPIVAAVTIEMAGSFNMSSAGAQWRAFTSTQRVVTRRPGFLWDAKISMVPGVVVRVIDSYIAGKGLLRAAIAGLYRLAEVRGDGEIARGEFMRWFAESAWYPTALLPSQGVCWEAVDDRSAHATIVDGPLALTLLFRFDDAGLMTSFRAEARGGTVGKKVVMAPWEGNWSNYRLCGGILVPFTGEVAWIRPEGRRPYFVGTVTSLAFDFSP